jgi:AcrR family transcriptional regulator/DNA-binding XRE family transcriptional regulator
MTGADSSGEAIRATRVESGLTVREVARRMQLSPATISAIENGKTGVSVSRLHAFAEVLNVPAAKLLAAAAKPGHSARDEGTQPSSSGQEPIRDWRAFPPLTLDPVLASALDAFVKTGYHGTTMRSLADHAGMSVPGIYHHYRDKQDLLVRLLDISMTELHWRVDSARDEASTSVEQVALIVEALALYHTHRRELAFIGATEMRSLNDANRLRIAQSRNHIQHLLDNAIDRAVADGHLLTRNSRAAGRAISTMCTSIPQWFRSNGPSSPEQIASEYSQFALAMLHGV